MAWLSLSIFNLTATQSIHEEGFAGDELLYSLDTQLHRELDEIADYQESQSVSK